MNKALWLVAYIVVGVLLGAGVLLLVTRPPRGDPIVLLPAPTPAPITVYVSGSVREPGLYVLPVGSRVNDAIQSAGGFNEQANPDVINLARILIDGEQVVVPALSPTDAGVSGTNPHTSTNILVNINTATLEQLDSLPEIGPITAQSIIGYRETNGPFLTLEALLEVDGIGQETFSKIRELITVGTSP